MGKLKKFCGFCNKPISPSENVLQHFAEQHPKMPISKKNGHVKCGICKSYIKDNSLSAIFLHFTNYHSKCFGDEDKPKTQKVLDVSRVDELLKGVDQNMAMLKLAQGKNEELQKKLIEYASRIVELQNLLAADAHSTH